MAYPSNHPPGYGVLYYTMKVTMHSIRDYIGLFLIISTLLGCQSDDAEVGSPNADLFAEQQQTIEQHLTERNITTQQSTEGIHYQVLTENASGVSPEPGQVVDLYYRLEELEGGLVDERQAASGDEPVTYTFEFTNPNAFHLTLPVSLDDIVGLMRVGEEYEFYLPSGAAYLDFGLSDRLPPQSIVRFRIEVAAVRTPAEQRAAEDARLKTYLADQNLSGADSLSSGVYYVRTQEGEGDVVSQGARVQVRYTGLLLDGTVFDSNLAAGRDPFEVVIGESESIEGFARGIEQMRLGEQGTIVMPSHTAYRDGIVAIPYDFIDLLLDQEILNPRVYGFARSIPPFSPLRFDVEVVAVN